MGTRRCSANATPQSDVERHRAQKQVDVQNVFMVGALKPSEVAILSWLAWLNEVNTPLMANYPRCR